MIWKKGLYRCGSIPESDKGLIRMAKWKKFPEAYFLVTLASNPKEYLEIWSGAELKKKEVRKHIPQIVGVASDYEKACELVLQIVEEALAAAGSDGLAAAMREKLKGFRS